METNDHVEDGIPARRVWFENGVIRRITRNNWCELTWVGSWRWWEGMPTITTNHINNKCIKLKTNTSMKHDDANKRWRGCITCKSTHANWQERRHVVELRNKRSIGNKLKHMARRNWTTNNSSNDFCRDIGNSKSSASAPEITAVINAFHQPAHATTAWDLSCEHPSFDRY